MKAIQHERFWKLPALHVMATRYSLVRNVDIVLIDHPYNVPGMTEIASFQHDVFLWEEIMNLVELCSAFMALRAHGHIYLLATVLWIVPDASKIRGRRAKWPAGRWWGKGGSEGRDWDGGGLTGLFEDTWNSYDLCQTEADRCPHGERDAARFLKS